jgi:F5/8 type C domain
VLPEAPSQPLPGERANSFPSEAELLKRPPVWQRMLRRLPVSVPGEGSLRKARSVRDRERHRALLRFGTLVAVIVLIGGGLWIASSRGGSSTDNGPQATTPPPALVRVPAASVAASTQSGSRVADNVIDGKLGTFWSRLVPSNDDQPFLRFSFDRPVELGRVEIASGASGTEFSKRPRPQEIELQFSDGTTLRTTLADRAGFQTVSFKPRTVDRVRLVMRSTYPSSGPQRTSISEVRFFAVK